MKTTKSKKALIAELKDLDLDRSKGSGKGTKEAGKKGKKGKGKKVLSLASIVTTFTNTSVVQKKRRDDSTSAPETEADGSPRRETLSGPEWVARLKKDNICLDHPGKACLKQGNQPHYFYSEADLSGWAVWMKSGYPSSTEPPPNSKLNNTPAENPVPQTQGPTPLQMTTPLPQPFSNPYAFFPSPYTYPPAPGPPQWPPYPYAEFPLPQRKRKYYEHDIPSSDSIDEDIEDSELYPRVEDWLAELDDGPRGKDGHNFASYTAGFIAKKYFRVIDISEMTAQDIVRTCAGIEDGTVSKLIKYARQDVDKIKKRAKKRGREERGRNRIR
ncbi:hypothetical protein HGRIS_011976 [Hohenbuehelia grisea]|uniref:Uncharacterized protein n=1 Tax=Hohenbuehelia grisea TaxID=104357 RepID=A0ABR3JXQ1_9AGAR